MQYGELRLRACSGRRAAQSSSFCSMSISPSTSMCVFSTIAAARSTTSRRSANGEISSVSSATTRAAFPNTSPRILRSCFVTPGQGRLSGQVNRSADALRSTATQASRGRPRQATARGRSSAASVFSDIGSDPAAGAGGSPRARRTMLPPRCFSMSDNCAHRKSHDHVMAIASRRHDDQGRNFFVLLGNGLIAQQNLSDFMRESHADGA